MTSLKQTQAVILDLAATHQNDLSLASLEKLPLTWQYHQNTQANEVVERVQDKTVVVVNKVVFSSEESLHDEREENANPEAARILPVDIFFMNCLLESVLELFFSIS